MTTTLPTAKADRQAEEERLRRRNRRLAAGVGGLVAGMVGLSFAAVPLYDLFCRATGYNGTVQTGGPAAPGAGRSSARRCFRGPSPWRTASRCGSLSPSRRRSGAAVVATSRG
jgi:cytochrome c oxidase assembly protein subunit 11